VWTTERTDCSLGVTGCGFGLYCIVCTWFKACLVFIFLVSISFCSCFDETLLVCH
jgi:hypothetical protein